MRYLDLRKKPTTTLGEFVTDFVTNRALPSVALRSPVRAILPTRAAGYDEVILSHRSLFERRGPKVSLWALQIGRIVADYEILGLLGVGGMAVFTACAM